jgi:hypothetical protein
MRVGGGWHLKEIQDKSNASLVWTEGHVFIQSSAHAQHACHVRMTSLGLEKMERKAPDEAIGVARKNKRYSGHGNKPRPQCLTSISAHHRKGLEPLGCSPNGSSVDGADIFH